MLMERQQRSEKPKNLAGVESTLQSGGHRIVFPRMEEGDIVVQTI